MGNPIPAGAVRRFLPAALLVGVAAVQLVLVQTHGLTRWRGGGMGMYAEFHPNRTELWAVGGVPQRVEDLPDDRWRDGCPWSERAALCRRLPTPQCLERLAACLSPASPIDRLEAWRPVFAPRTRTWSRRLVAVHGADAR